MSKINYKKLYKNVERPENCFAYNKIDYYKGRYYVDYFQQDNKTMRLNCLEQSFDTREEAQFFKNWINGKE